jgi:hypothetical protein
MVMVSTLPLEDPQRSFPLPVQRRCIEGSSKRRPATAIPLLIIGQSKINAERRKRSTYASVPVGEKSEDDVSGGTIVVVASGFISGIQAFNDDECVAETNGHAV